MKKIILSSSALLTTMLPICGVSRVIERNSIACGRHLNNRLSYTQDLEENDIFNLDYGNFYNSHIKKSPFLPQSPANYFYNRDVILFDQMNQNFVSDVLPTEDGEGVIFPWSRQTLINEFPNAKQAFYDSGIVGITFPFRDADEYADWMIANKWNLAKLNQEGLEKYFAKIYHDKQKNQNDQEQILFFGQNEFLSDNPREFSSADYYLKDLKPGTQIDMTHASLNGSIPKNPYILSSQTETVANFGNNCFNDSTIIDLHGDSAKNCRIIYYKFRVDITVPAHLNVDYHYGIHMDFKIHHHGNYKAFKGHANGDYSFQLFYMGENDVLPEKIIQPWNNNGSITPDKLDKYSIYQETFHANGDDKYDKSWFRNVSDPFINLTIFNKNNDQPITKSYYFGAAISCKSHPNSMGNTWFDFQFKPHLYQPQTILLASSKKRNLNKNINITNVADDVPSDVSSRRYHCEDGNKLDKISLDDLQDDSHLADNNLIAYKDEKSTNLLGDSEQVIIEQKKKNNDGYAVSVPISIPVVVPAHTAKKITFAPQAKTFFSKNSRISFYDCKLKIASHFFNQGIGNTPKIKPDYFPIVEDEEEKPIDNAKYNNQNQLAFLSKFDGHTFKIDDIGKVVFLFSVALASFDLVCILKAFSGLVNGVRDLLSYFRQTNVDVIAEEINHNQLVVNMAAQIPAATNATGFFNTIWMMAKARGGLKALFRWFLTPFTSPGRWWHVIRNRLQRHVVATQLSIFDVVAEFNFYWEAEFMSKALFIADIVTKTCMAASTIGSTVLCDIGAFGDDVVFSSDFSPQDDTYKFYGPYGYDEDYNFDTQENEKDKRAFTYSFTNPTSQDKTYYVNWTFCQFKFGQRGAANDNSFKTVISYKPVDEKIIKL